MKKVLSVLVVALMLVCVSTNVFAALDMNSIHANATLSGDADNKMLNIGNTILTIVTNVAMILAVVIIAIIGVKYMMGSMEEKAEYKKTMMPYLIGAILVFGAGAIGKMVVGFASSF